MYLQQIMPEMPVIAPECPECGTLQGGHLVSSLDCLSCEKLATRRVELAPGLAVELYKNLNYAIEKEEDKLSLLRSIIDASGRGGVPRFQGMVAAYTLGIWLAQKKDGKTWIR